MFWVALSAFIMTLTGEGDDTFAIRRFLDRAREAVSENVHDAARQKKALEALERTAKAFSQHRTRAAKISACIEQADRKYAATAAEYRACLSDVGPTWDAASEQLISLSREFRQALTPAELAAIRHSAGK